MPRANDIGSVIALRVLRYGIALLPAEEGAVESPARVEAAKSECSWFLCDPADEEELLKDGDEGPNIEGEAEDGECPNV